MQKHLEQPLAALVERLRHEFPELLAVYRFGSFGTEYERPASDLDLAVYAGPPLPTVRLWNLAQKLATEVGRDVDLVDLASSSTVMRAQVIHESRRLYRRRICLRDLPGLRVLLIRPSERRSPGPGCRRM